MQGQAVVQMANQLPLNPVVKSGANSKNAVTTKSNSSFANEFKNAADNIVDSNATENIEGNVVQDNTQSILSALATLGIPNLAVNNLNAVTNVNGKSEETSSSIDVIMTADGQQTKPDNQSAITAEPLTKENIAQLQNIIKGQADIGVELSLGDKQNNISNNGAKEVVDVNSIVSNVKNSDANVKEPINNTNTVLNALSENISTQQTVPIDKPINSTQQLNNYVEPANNVAMIQAQSSTATNTTINSNAANNQNSAIVATNVVQTTSNVVKNDNIQNGKITKTENDVMVAEDETISPEKVIIPKSQFNDKEQSESSSQQKNSFATITEPTKPEQKNTEITAKNELFAHNISLATKNINVKSTESVEQPLTAAEKMDIPNQIVQQTKLIKGIEDTQMVIKLKPEHLGELTLKFVLDKGAVSASFHSDNQQVRNIIESSLVQLKQELSDQGIKVSHMGVYAGLSDLLSNGQQEQRQSQQTKFKNKKVDLADFEDEVDKVNGVKDVLSEDGVDYRI